MRIVYRTALLLSAASSLLAGCVDAEWASQGEVQTQISLGGMTPTQAAAAKALRGLRGLRTDQRGLPSYLAADLGVLRDDKLLQTGDLQSLQAALAPLLRMQPSEQLIVRRSFRDQQDQVHFWLGNTINDIDVIDSEIIVHTNGKTGEIVSLQLGYLPDEGLARVPRLGADAIVAAIPTSEMPVKNAVLTAPPKLAYLRLKDGTGALGWKLEVGTSAATKPPDCPNRPPSQPNPTSIMFADAESARILRKEGIDRSAKSREVYTALGPDACNTESTLGRLEVSEGQTTTNVLVKAAYDNSGIAYDFFSAALGRDSWDGAGARMTAVNTRFEKMVAYFRTDHIVLGTGDNETFASFALSPDIVAHEYTHGIVERTAHLAYQDESGALDESIADALGVSAKAFARGLSQDTWKIGVESYTPNLASDALRYMNTPRLDGLSPDYYPSRLLGDADSGFVHYNSGIGNLAFYLLVQGGGHPRLPTGVTVPAIGIAKAQQIYYKALSHLSVTSGFVDMRQATACAANEIAAHSNDCHQTADQNPPEKVAVCKAWDAVGVPGIGAGDLCPVPPATVPDPLPPPAPTDVVAQSEHCHNKNTVHWNGSGTSFEIYTFANTTTTLPGTRVYVVAGNDQSPGPAASVNLGEGMIVRVRGCNSGGCSDFSTSFGVGHTSSGCS